MGLSEDLYREVILDHYKNPRHRGRLEAPTVAVEGVNPLCGDELAITLEVKDGRIVQAAIDGRGCSISQASASMMMEAIHGKPVEEAKALIDRFKKMMMTDEAVEWEEDYEDIEALEGVKKYPVRIKCALLSWNTLLQGLERPQDDSCATYQYEEGESGNV